MKLFTIGILCLLLTCCTVRYETQPILTGDTHLVEVYYKQCSDEPYYAPPEWCDWYDDGTTCCVWNVDGWYEEWCQWENDWCWEFSGAWQKDLV